MVIEIAVEKLVKRKKESKCWNFNAMSTFHFSITLNTHTHTHSLLCSHYMHAFTLYEFNCVSYINPMIERCVQQKQAAVAIVRASMKRICGESDYGAGIKGDHIRKLLYYRWASATDQFSSVQANQISCCRDVQRLNPFANVHVFVFVYVCLCMNVRAKKSHWWSVQIAWVKKRTKQIKLLYKGKRQDQYLVANCRSQWVHLKWSGDRSAMHFPHFNLVLFRCTR